MTLNDYVDFDKLWADILEVEKQNLKDAHDEYPPDILILEEYERLQLYDDVYEFIDELGSDIEILTEECIIDTKTHNIVYFCFSILTEPSNEINNYGEYIFYIVGYDLTNDEFVCFERDI